LSAQYETAGLVFKRGLRLAFATDPEILFLFWVHGMWTRTRSPSYSKLAKCEKCKIP